jgi:endonuclease G
MFTHFSMGKGKFFRLLIMLFSTLFFASCQEDFIEPIHTNLSSEEFASASLSTITETFESVTKTSYSGGYIYPATGTWYLSDALVGTLSSDRKSGYRSARIRNSGRLTMLFDITGVTTVSIRHAKFGSDGNSAWELWKSTNGGSSYIKVGSTINTTSTSLYTANFSVNSSVPTRFEIRKVSGGSNRINIDDVKISYGAGGGSQVVHLTMGNPSSATASAASYSNYLMDKDQYSLAYHRDWGIPRWTSWHLSNDWIGSAPRQDDFRTDTALPSGWYRVGGSSYSGSGFDRGHMCPSADRTASATDNSSTFLMTNMIPQAPDNNQGPWASFENYLRTLLASGKELYIISGGYGQGGSGSNGYATTINSGRVRVPSRTFKVVLVLDQGSNDLNRVTSSTPVIAIDMPNSQGIRSYSWTSFKTTVDDIEAQTGLNFFSNVSTTIQASIESRVY